MINNKRKLGNKIREIRNKKELTQEDLAYYADLDYSYVNQIENGRRNPSIDAIEKIAKALGVKTKDLIPY
jgi:transcriptional regulator with XRE-family HTH domain